MSLIFYHAPLSNSDRIRFSLAELGVAHETIKVDIRAGEQKKPEFLALNPNGKVPTVVLDGTPMFESVAIQIALGERYGVAKGLWPATGSAEHLKALSWIVWGQVSLAGPLFRYLQNTSEYFPKELHHAGQAEAALKDTHAMLAILDAHLGANPFIAGGGFSLVDVDVFSVLGWGLQAAKIDAAAYPKLGPWMGGVAQRPAIRAAMGPR